jgi:C_GCAxxG_C_C family probable redox protein
MTKMAEIVSSEEKEEILERVEQRAASYMYEYKGCGQAALLALQQEFKLPGGSAALKAASFTARGVARLGDMCGALSAGIMAFGLASGRENLEDSVYPNPEVIDQASGLPRSLVLVRRFYQRFVQEFGGSTCRDIQIKMFGRSYDMGNPEENEEFSKLSNTKCSELVGQVARLAAETILEMPRR